MRRRLLITYVSLLAVTIGALAIPFAIDNAARHNQAAFIDRQGDAARFASLAAPTLDTGELVTLRAELEVYGSLFGVDAAIVGRDGTVIAASSTNVRLDDEPTRTAVSTALAGNRTGLDRTIWPWQEVPLVVAEPIARGGEIVGASVTVSPTDRIRAATLRGWALVAVVALLAIMLAWLAALPLTGWVLRPVVRLDAAVQAVTAGRLGAQVPPQGGPAELRRLVAAFNTMTRTINGLIERQRRFVYYASHQLRNPLAALRLRVENLAVHVGSAGAEDYERTLREVDRLTGVCDGVLSLARAEAATPPPGAHTDAAEVADERVAGWAAAAANAGVLLHRDGAAVAHAAAPPDVLAQVLDALLDNAVKFCRPGGTVTVTVTVIRPTGSVALHVVDDGPGLPAADLDRATEPFWRSRGHQNVPGSGLGLAIVTALLAPHRGRVHLRPAAPCGLHVEVTLPAPVRASPTGSTEPPPGAVPTDT